MLKVFLNRLLRGLIIRTDQVVFCLSESCHGKCHFVKFVKRESLLLLIIAFVISGCLASRYKSVGQSVRYLVFFPQEDSNPLLV